MTNAENTADVLISNWSLATGTRPGAREVVNGLDGRRLTPGVHQSGAGAACGTCSTGRSDASTSIGCPSGAAQTC